MNESALREPLWTKNFIVIGLINFILMLGSYIVMVAIAQYAIEEIGTSAGMAGIMAGITIVGAFLSRFITGRLTLIWGYRKTLFFGAAFFLFMSIPYFLTEIPFLLIIIRLLHGFAFGMSSTAAGAVAAHILSPTRRSEGVVIFTLSIILGTAIGPFLGIFLIQQPNGFNIVFISNVLISLLCVLLFFLADIPRMNSPAKPLKAPKKGFLLANYIEYKAVPVSIPVFLACFTFAGIMTFLTPYTKDIQLLEAGGYFYVVYSITILLTRPITGRLLARSGANRIILPSLLLNAVGMVFYSQASTGFMLLVSAGFIGLGFGNFASSAQALAIKEVEPHRMGLATSTYFAFYDLGLGLGSFIIGFLTPVIGYRVYFLSMVPVIILSLVLYVFLVGRYEKRVLEG